MFLSHYQVNLELYIYTLGLILISAKHIISRLTDYVCLFLVDSRGICHMWEIYYFSNEDVEIIF